MNSNQLGRVNVATPPIAPAAKASAALLDERACVAHRQTASWRTIHKQNGPSESGNTLVAIASG